METKKCKKCGQEKPLSDFNKKNNKTQFACKICHNEIAKSWYAKKKTNNFIKTTLYERNNKRERYLQKLVDSIKEKLKCQICSEPDPCCLDFHHKTNEKGRNVSAWVSAKSLNNIINEIQKCVCVCANCHRKIHAKKIECPSLEISSDDIKNMVAAFEIVNPWVVEYKRIKKPKTLKNRCLHCLKETNNSKYCSTECSNIGKRQVCRPDVTELQQKIATMSMVDVGRFYGVTDNTIRKWLK